MGQAAGCAGSSAAAAASGRARPMRSHSATCPLPATLHSSCTGPPVAADVVPDIDRQAAGARRLGHVGAHEGELQRGEGRENVAGQVKTCRRACCTDPAAPVQKTATQRTAPLHRPAPPGAASSAHLDPEADVPGGLVNGAEPPQAVGQRGHLQAQKGLSCACGWQRMCTAARCPPASARPARPPAEAAAAAAAPA